MPISLDLPWCDAAPAETRYLVAVSGGRDSVALLHLLRERGFENLVVCHLDHQLRGVDSARDADFVRHLAAELGLSAEVATAPVAELAKRQNLSLERAARQARHRFFAQAAAIHGTNRVLLGHHLDDQAETILFNLCRGSAGLKGMRTESEHRIDGRSLTFIRPLLHLRRSELTAYLRARGLAFREDASNAEPFTPRNRLRHEAIPLLAEICDRDIAPALARAAAAQHERDQALAAWAEEVDALDPQGRLHLPTLQRLPRALQRHLIHQFLAQHQVPDLDRSLLDRALALVDRGPAKINLPGGRFLRRRQARIFIE